MQSIYQDYNFSSGDEYIYVCMKYHVNLKMLLVKTFDKIYNDIKYETFALSVVTLQMLLVVRQY